MSIRRHTLQNLAGTIAPMLISFAVVPIYLHLIGPARYGVLTIVWLFLGYFGVFDLGLARATSFHLARLHDDVPSARASVFYTALALNAGFGTLGALVLLLIAPLLFLHVFHMPDALRLQVLAVLPWLALAIPLATVTGVLAGTLQAREKFGAWNLIGTLNTMLAQFLPLGVAFFHGPDLTWLIPSVVIGRMIGFVPFAALVWRAVPLGQGGRFEARLLRDLFGYGGWIFVTNILDPILSTMDRMLIGGVIGADAVAYYSVPFNLVSRLSGLAGALPTSLFPKMSRQGMVAGARLATEALVMMAAVLTPVIIGGILVMPIFLRIWVGAIFAGHSALVGMILLPGIWINSMAFIAYDQLQAANRPDLTAKFHLAELLPFLAILWLGLHYFGLAGAAAAWSLRVAADAGLLIAATRQWPALWRASPGALMVLLAIPVAPTTLISDRSFAGLGLLIVACAWSLSVEPRLRSFAGLVRV